MMAARIVKPVTHSTLHFRSSKRVTRVTLGRERCIEIRISNSNGEHILAQVLLRH